MLMAFEMCSISPVMYFFAYLGASRVFSEQATVVGLGTNAKCSNATVEAAARVFAEHGTFIRAVIRFQTSDESGADDLYQQFFLRLVRKPLPPRLDNVRSYLYRAITNDVLDSARQRQKYRYYLKKYSKKIRISINKEAPTNAFLETEESDSLFGLLARQLPQRQSQAVTMRYRDNYSLSEIAAEMGIARQTASQYLTSGLKRLRGALAIE